MVTRKKDNLHMLGVRIPIKMRNQLAKIARDKELSMTYIVKSWIRKGIKEYRENKGTES